MSSKTRIAGSPWLLSFFLSGCWLLTPNAPVSPTATPQAPSTPSAAGEPHKAKPAAPVEIRPLLEAATSAYKESRYLDTVDLAHRSLALEGADPRAFRLLGAASCFLGDRVGAREAWYPSTKMDRKLLEYICGRNGLPVP